MVMPSAWGAHANLLPYNSLISSSSLLLSLKFFRLSFFLSYCFQFHFFPFFSLSFFFESSKAWVASQEAVVLGPELDLESL